MNELTPVGRPSVCRLPAALVGRDVCYRCRQPVTVHCFSTPDGTPIKTYHCPEHGDVAPMRSHVIRHG